MNSDVKTTSEDPVEVRLYISPRAVTDDDLRGCSAIVIDVLRASATVAAALAIGARDIIPVQSPAEAGELASRSGRKQSLLCGEREGKRIDGFDLGNSPFEYTADKVAGRTLIYSSTNGSGAVLRARAAERVYMAGFINFNAVLRRVIDDGNPVVIVCSGMFDQFAIEDFVCGGKFVTALETRCKRTLQLNDGARAAAILHRHFDGSLTGLLKSSAHGRYLASLGFEEDIDFCSRLDTHPVVPMFIEGKLRGYKPDGSPLIEPAVSAV